MNLKEQHIIDSLIKETLDAEELSALKKNLETKASYEIFLSKLLSIITNKDKTISLLDFLKFNNLSGKFLFIQNKKTDIIEELAELFYKGHESEITTFLAHTNDDIFNRHIQFLKETHNAIIFSERNELKKKLEKLDELSEFNLDENEIKAAVTSHERQILRKHFSELAKNTEVEVDTDINIESHYSRMESVGFNACVEHGEDDYYPDFKKPSNSKVINFKYRTVLRYAAILILVIGPAIFIVNQINKQNTAEPNIVAKNDTEEQSISTSKQYAINDTKKQGDPIKIKIEPFEFQLPIATSFSGECIIQEKTKFGFSSNDIKQVNITVVNLSNQIDAAQKKLHKEIKGNGARAKSIQNKLDSLIALSETYTYSQGVIIIYSTRLQANSNTFTNIKLVAIEQNNNTSLYSKIFENYYFIIETKKNSKLIKETKEDVIERIKMIENKNE